MRHSVTEKQAAPALRSPVRAYRRRLPLGRAAVLIVAGRNHVVGVADVSATGAFLITRAALAIGRDHLLKLVPAAGRPELTLRARVVRVVQSGEELPHHLDGVAVEFTAIDEETRKILEAFVHRSAMRPR